MEIIILAQLYIDEYKFINRVIGEIKRIFHVFSNNRVRVDNETLLIRK